MAITKEKEMFTSAVLSTLYKTQKKDNIELLIPFVKYSIGKNFSVGDSIKPDVISKYLTDNFSYKIFPEAVILKIFTRILKHENVIIRENKEYKYNVDLSEVISKFEINKSNAETLINDVTDELLIYLQQIEKESISLEKTKSILFNFLDSYGIFAYENINNLEAISYKSEHYNFLVGKFVIKLKNENSSTFNKLVDLVKGMMLSRAIYLQVYDASNISLKFKDVLVFSDTSLLMSVLGLKSEYENNLANEFYESIPKNVKKVYFPHTLDEIYGILRKYLSNKENKTKQNQTIELFDENNYTSDDVEDYILRLELHLKNKGFVEWQNDLDIDVKNNETIDENGLRKYLKDNIPYSSEKMLDNDIKSLYYIKRIRKGKTFNSIENCKAVFVTSNYNLVRYVKKYIPDIGFHYLITHIDFIVLLWLKSNMRNDSPRQLLISNALAATETVGDNFIKAIIDKVEKLKKESSINDAESLSLLVEDYYARKEIMEETNCNPDNLTIETINKVTETFKDKILYEAQINNAQLEKENKDLTKQLIETQKAIKNKAKVKSEKISRNITICMKIIMWIILSVFIVTGTVFTIINLINGNLKGLGFIVLLIIGIFGIVDIVSRSKSILNNLIKKISMKIKNKVYSDEIENILDNKN